MLDFKLRLNHDLRALGCNLDNVCIEFRPYSKNYYGRYYPNKDGKAKVVVYAHDTKDGVPFDYVKLLKVTVHELVHHEQYMSPHFKRVRGVMHNEEFYKLYGEYERKIDRMYGGIYDGSQTTYGKEKHVAEVPTTC